MARIFTRFGADLSAFVECMGVWRRRLEWLESGNHYSGDRLCCRHWIAARDTLA